MIIYPYYWLLAIGCLLPATGFWLLVAGYWLPATGSLLLAYSYWSMDS